MGARHREQPRLACDDLDLQLGLAGLRSREGDADLAVQGRVDAQYLADHPSPGRADRSARLLSTGNRPWYSGDLIAAAPLGYTGPAADAIASAERLRERYAQLARSLRDPRAAPGPLGALPGQNAGAGGDLHAWLDDLAAGAVADEPANAERRR